MKENTEYVCPICHFRMYPIQKIGFVEFQCSDLKCFCEGVNGRGYTTELAYAEILKKLSLSKNQISDLEKVRGHNNPPIHSTLDAIRKNNLENFGSQNKNHFAQKDTLKEPILTPKKLVKKAISYSKLENFLEKK